MKFLIRSNDDYDGKKKPCKKAKKELAVYLDIRSVSTLKEAKLRKWGTDFFSRGTNHREATIHGNKVVCCDWDAEKVWIIELESLEDLLQIKNECGNIAITTSRYKDIEYEITIMVYPEI